MNKDEVISAMPDICRTALIYGHDPLFAVECILCAGLDEDAAAHIKSVAHNWMYIHQREWPWHVKKPDNHDSGFLTYQAQKSP